MTRNESTGEFVDAIAAALNEADDWQSERVDESVVGEFDSASSGDDIYAASASAAGDLPVLKRLAKNRAQRNGRRTAVPRWLLWLGALRSRLQFAGMELRKYCVANRQQIITGSVSFGVHLMIAAVLGLWVLDIHVTENLTELVATITDVADRANLPMETPEITFPETLQSFNVDSTIKEIISEFDAGQTAVDVMSLHDREFLMPLTAATDATGIPAEIGHFAGRSAAGRRAGLEKFGGTGDSEKAVNLGLIWLKSIQRPDGSWNFAQVGDAGTPGTLNTTDMGATSLALLCFLGAGHTHRFEGPYKDVVASGIDYMLKSAQRDSTGTDLRGRAQGNSGLYVQGLATICLCEASAMEPDDKDLRRVVIEAIAFIERTQDPIGGGWRYAPRQPGDTSVVGWQLMALQSARAAKIRVAGSTFRDVRIFLDSVQADGGAYYGYMQPQNNRPPMTAVGLLCRMYMGWKHDHPGLKRGVEFLSRNGPSRDDIYYNYYATQVVRHYGGAMWEEWNPKMRQFLVETQVREGAGAGSWNVTDPHGSSGGRIYQTALSILTLEVYYRHLPLYRNLEEGSRIED